MRRLLSFLALLILTACATPQLATDHRGADAGHMVVGIGAASGTRYSSYTLLFRRVDSGGTTGEVGRLQYFQGSGDVLVGLLYKPKRDYENDKEKGVVAIASLPAGNYEIFNFSVFLNTGMFQNTYSSREPFSIPFTVKVGQAVYVGNYQANDIRGRNLFGLPVSAGAVFVVEDRYTADMEIARRLNPLLGQPAVDATPDAAKLGNPLLIKPGALGKPS